MATGFGLSIDDSFLKELQEADRLIDKIHNKSNKLKASTVSAFKEMSEKGVMHYVDSLKKQKKMLEEIGKIKNTGHNRLLTNLQRDAKLTVDEINKVVQALERTKNYKGEATGRTAISFANSILGKRGDKSIDNLRTALRQLEEAQNRQNLNTKRGQDNFNKLRDAIARVKNELNNATGASDKFKNSNDAFMRATASLRSQLSLLYSISKISAYVEKMVQVRKEFELQHKSMQILLRDKDEADRLWQQTIDLAVKSPFRISELVRYTKQLAAYRIETSKLHDTTKMLSDVSAGLGVDMNRLILAFGQVRAANYLRGTELRQFTEAGIPMLDELAKMFEEIEGRAVSAGDVFERISKRMVNFTDVEEVFKRMTSESGVFYNMQEEQSKTLAGMISNLHDSVDLMLNDIGKANDGTIKELVSITRSFVENWRAAAVVIKQVGVSLAILNIAKFASGWRLVATEGAAAAMAMNGVSGAAARLRVGLTSLGATIKAHPILMLVGVVASVAHATWEYVKAVDAANKKYDEMSRRDVRRIDRLQELKDKTEEYNQVIKNSANNEIEANKAKEENKKILNELKSKYPDVFNSIKQQTDGTLELANAIEIQNQKLIQNIALQQKAKGGFFQDTQEENYKESINELGVLENAINDFKVVAINASVKLSESFSKGLVSKEDYERFSELLRQVKTAKGFDNVSSAYKRLTNEFVKNSGTVKKQVPLLGMFAEQWLSLVQANADYNSSLKDLGDNFKKQGNIIKVAIDEIFENHKGNEDAGEAAAGAWIEGFLDEFGIIDKNIRDWAKEFIPNMINIKVVYPNKKEIGEPLLAWQESYNRLFKGFAGFVKIAQSTTKQDTVIERLNAQIKETEELITRINNAGGIKATLSGGAYEGQDLSALNKELEQLKKQQQWFGEESKKNNKNGTENISKQISLIKEMHKQYKELNNEFGDIAAKEKVMTSYASAFAEIFEEAGLSMSAKIIDDKAIANLKESGNVTEDVIAKIEELSNVGTYIRNFSDDFVSSIKYAEGFIEKAENIGDGVFTYGYGETKGVKEGDTITKEKADLQLRKRLTEDFVTSLNKVLDANKDIILTQEQYNSLLDLTYQGGEGAVKRLINYAKNEEKAIAHIQSIYEKVKSAFGEKEAERFGDAFVVKFKEAENIYDRIALLLQTMNLTVKKGEISSKLYQGMQKRSDERALLFSTGKEVSDIVQQASIEISNINIENAKGVVDTLKKLVPYAKSIGDKAVEPLLKAIAEFESEIELEPKIKERESIEDQIAAMFGNYEISLELEKLNIPPDLAKQLFNIDDIDLSELREKALSFFKIDTTLTNQEIFDSEQFKLLANNQQKLIKDTLEKIKKLEDEELKDRLKKYTQYLVRAQNERVKLKIEELRAIKEVENMNEFTEGQKDTIKRKIQLETQQEMDKQSWKEFKESDMYVQMFGDLEKLGTKSIKALQSQLEGLKDSLKDLPATELKAIMEEIDKVNTIAIDRNPFQSLMESLKEVQKLKAQGKTKDVLEQELQDASRKQKDYQDELNAIQLIQNQKAKGLDLSQLEVELGDKYRYLIGATDEQLENTSVALNRNIELEKEKARTASSSLKVYEDAENSIQGTVAKTEAWGQAISSVLSSTDALLDALGVAEDDSSRIWLQAAEQMAQMVVQTVILTASMSALGVAVKSALGPIGWIAMALQAVTLLFSSIFGASDKKKEKQIKREIELVNKLEKMYEKLQKRIEDTYNLDTYERAIDMAQGNLKERIEATERMIAAEESKKKTDESKIASWKNEIDDMKQELMELEEQRTESLGGFGSQEAYKSATEAFVDAWLEAYKETGDGLTGLSEQFDEFFEDMIKKQLIYRGTDKFLNNFYQQFDKMFAEDSAGGGQVTLGELEEIKQTWKSVSPELDKFLDGMMETLGIAGELKSSTNLSGLQKGIQGITEDTAQIIEAYLNSIRFFVAENNTYLSQIASSFSNTEIENPMVSQLKIIASQTTAINELLNSLTSGGHSMGGRGFRVFVS